jgi:hypothetical protein
VLVRDEGRVGEEGEEQALAQEGLVEIEEVFPEEGFAAGDEAPDGAARRRFGADAADLVDTELLFLRRLVPGRHVDVVPAVEVAATVFEVEAKTARPADSSPDELRRPADDELCRHVRSLRRRTPAGPGDRAG